MKKFAQSSLVDFLIQRMPELHPNMLRRHKMVDVHAAANLFNVWKNKENEIGDKLFKKPLTISSMDVDAMEEEGLIVKNGEQLKITAKGTEVIKTMLLGDDRSIYEENGKQISYKQACENVNQPTSRMKKNSEIKVDNLWWGRFNA